MKIEKLYDEGCVGYNILEVRPVEVHEMLILKEQIEKVVKSHKENSEKKLYINDEQLTQMWAILSVLTEGSSLNEPSAFEKYLKTHEI